MLVPGEPFQTERLQFRLLSPDDLDVVHRQFSDPEMCRYFSEPPMSQQDAIDTIDMFQRPDRDPYLRYAMIELQTGQFVGTCGYHHFDCELSQVEVGYDVWREFWRQGYITEAIPELVRICFNELQVNLVYVLVHKDNAGSLATARKAGFKESEPCRPLDEPDQVCMKLTRIDWERTVSGW